MKCDVFTILQDGEIYCHNPRSIERVGSVADLPRHLSSFQREQVEAWSAVKAVADSVAPIFGVTSPLVGRVEVNTHFRLPAGARRPEEQLSTDVKGLFSDLRSAGWNVARDWTLLPDPEGGRSVIWTLTVLVDPTLEDPASILPALEYVARAVADTRLGDHLLDPALGWPPVRRIMSGRGLKS